MSSRTMEILSAFPAPPKHIDFTVGLDWLSPEEKALFQRKAEKSYRKAGRLLNPRKYKAKVRKPRTALVFETEKDVPQVCQGQRLITLAEAQNNKRIKYFGFDI